MMGDQECSDVSEVSEDEIKEERIRIGSVSPTPTVLQTGSLSPTKGQIRLRPLQALINLETSPTIDIGDEEEEGNPGVMKQNGDNKWKNLNIGNSSGTNWRSGCRGVREKLRFILDHEDSYQDVTFVVGKYVKERMSGHKLILRLGSPVLDKIFLGPKLPIVSDKASVETVPDTDEIPVPDVEPFAFRYLLKYIYTDEFVGTGLTSSDIMAILHGAKLFEVHDLVQDCVQSLKDNVTDQNAVDLCELARQIDDFELRELAISHICRNAMKILTAPLLFDLTYPSLLLLIDSNDLELDEYLVFKAAVEWGKESCKKQNLDSTPDSIRVVLNEILYKIRFPIMSTEEFIDEVSPTKILSSDEQVEIFKYLCRSGSKRDQYKPTGFICSRRNHMEIKLEANIKDEKEDGNSDRFKPDPGDSPNCQPSLASNLNEITETESEDASSHVSSVRSHGSSIMTPSKKRPHLRSPSPSHSKTSKKSKTTSSSCPKPEKVKRQKSIDSEKDIYLQDCEIELNQFIQGCSTNPRRKEIESIRLSGVKVTDHKRLKNTRVRFPKLKEFHLDIQIPTLKHSDVNRLAGDLVLEEFLFFNIKVGETGLTLSNLWSLGINLSLVINGITMIKVDHSLKNFTINKLKDASNILSSTRGDTGVKSLVLSHQKFPEHADLFPSQSLERLVLLSITHIPEVNKFLKRFKRLKELCLLSTEMKKIDLCNDLVSEKLKKLAVGSAKFSFPLPAALKSLEELFLWRCEWTSAFEENFHLLFPNLKKVSITGSKTNPKLLKKIFKIKSIEEVACSLFDWSNTESEEHDEMKDVIVSCGLADDERSFVLTKNEDASGWKGKKGSLDFKQEIFKNFQFYHLYVNYEIFRS